MSVLENLPLPSDVLSDLSVLDAATNERKIAERGRNSAIGPGELLFGVPEADIVNAAFAHPGPFGGRFNSTQRGAWYADVEIATSVAEVAFHKRRFLAEGRVKGQHTFDYIDFRADFSSLFRTLDARERKSCLKPDPWQRPWCLVRVALTKALKDDTVFEISGNRITYSEPRSCTG